MPHVDSWPPFETLTVTPADGRVHVALDRPEQRNAIDATMAAELTSVCERLEVEPQILILSGTTVRGKGLFASGADISQMIGRTRDDALRGINSTVFRRIAQLPMPVIAAVDGWALGGGAELAYAADFRIATPHVRFGQPEVNLGIVAAAGALWRLKELVGEPVAKEMLLAGRILDADEALQLRLVSEIVSPEDLLAAAHRLADTIGEFDPLAIRLTKAVFHMPPDAHPMAEQLAQAVAFESDEKVRRMQAFLDRKQTKKEHR